MRVCHIDRQTECGEIHINERADRTENRHNVEEAADDQEPNTNSVHFGGRTDRISGYTGNPQGEE